MRRRHRTTLATTLVGVLLAGATCLAAKGPPAAADGNSAPSNPATFRALSVGSTQACAILANSSVRCWGANSLGQLGLGDTNNRGDATNEMGAFLPAVNLGTGRTATALATGQSHTCALLDNASVKCWGANASGQLGLGDTTNRGDSGVSGHLMGDSLPAVALGTGRTATAITAGGFHTCALLDNGTVKCWGQSASGELGLGDTTNRGDSGVSGHLMGDSLPAVSLGTGRTATAIVAGDNHTCALLDNATVKCWGANGSGQLGLGDVLARGDAPNEMGNSLPTVALGTGRTAAAITAGAAHTCALLDNSTVKCWGAGANGRLGQGDTTNRGDAANEMGDNLPAVALGAGRTANAVTAGVDQTCVRLDTSAVKCWGSNDSGQLGLGDINHRGDAANEMGDSLPTIALGTGRTVTAIDAGGFFTCATLDTGARKCWGANSTGRLGLEDAPNRGDGAGEMGDNLPTLFLPPAGILSGTVTDSVSNQPVTSAVVAILRTSDFSVVTSDATDGSGNYAADVPPGSYYLYLLDLTGGHANGFFGSPTPTTVFAADGGTTDSDPTIVPNRGSFSGFVTDQASGAPLSDIHVLAIGPNGLVGGTTTSLGNFTMTGLPVGSYRAEFIDGAGTHLTEFWDNSPDFAGSSVINVTAGGNTTGVNAALFRP